MLTKPDGTAAGAGTDAAPTGRKAATQERIVAAAIALFAAHGYDGTSTSAIAERAGVSRSSIFWHFGDKEGLFREGFRRMLLPLFTEMQASLMHLPPAQRMFEILAAYERVVHENQAVIQTLIRWLLESEQLRASLQETLFSLHDSLQGDFRQTFEDLGADADEAVKLGAAVMTMLDGSFLLAILDPAPEKRELRAAGLRAVAARLVDADERDWPARPLDGGERD